MKIRLTTDRFFVTCKQRLRTTIYSVSYKYYCFMENERTLWIERISVTLSRNQEPLYKRLRLNVFLQNDKAGGASTIVELISPGD